MAIKDGLLKLASNFVEAVIPPYICLSITERNLQGWVPLHYDTSISIPTIPAISICVCLDHVGIFIPFEVIESTFGKRCPVPCINQIHQTAFMDYSTKLLLRTDYHIISNLWVFVHFLACFMT